MAGHQQARILGPGGGGDRPFGRFRYAPSAKWPGCWCFGLLQKKCCTRTAASDALRNLSKREVDLLGISGKIVEEDGGIVRVLIRIKDTARLRFGRVSLHITTGDGTTSSVWTGEQTGPLNVEFTISRKMIGDCSVFLGISDKGVPVLQEEGSPTYLLDLTSELIFGNLNPLSPQKEDNRRNTSSQPMKSKKSSR